MKSEITIITDADNGARSILVGNVEQMRVYADGTIEAFGGVIGDVLRSEVFPVQTADYLAWVTEEAAKLPAIPV